jgi:hypothetical protein
VLEDGLRSQSETFNGTPLIAAVLIYRANGLERRLNRRVA